MAIEWEVLPEREKPHSGTSWVYDDAKQTWVIARLMMIRDDAPGLWQPVPVTTLTEEE